VKRNTGQAVEVLGFADDAENEVSEFNQRALYRSRLLQSCVCPDHVFLESSGSALRTALLQFPPTG
jgi:hypothetical protein